MRGLRDLLHGLTPLGWTVIGIWATIGVIVVATVWLVLQ